MIRSLYSALMWALQPLLKRKLRQRALREPGYALHVQERFGHYSMARPPASLLVWVDAVSLGETRAAKILIEALRHAHPHVRVLLTHGTATGRQAGQALLREGDVQVWQPWDTPAIVHRFLQHFRPDVGLLLETEVWPNWVFACRAAHVPLLLVNARMSEKSLRQGQRLRWLARPTYAGLTAVLAQSADDQTRLQTLGANVIGAFGNIKFDARPDPAHLALALHWRKSLTRPVVLLASTREGEEEMWLDAMQAIADLQNIHAAHWLIVPRHPQRFEEVSQLMQSRGWTVSRRSHWPEDGPQPTDVNKQPVVWLGDSMGEMSLYYELADVALLGGSFAPLGGQNLIEATACGCPVVMGPHTFNFAEAAQLAEEAGAAIAVQDMAQAVTTALHLAESAQEENVYVQACLNFTEQHRGAAQHTVQALKPWLQAPLEGRSL